MRPEKELIEKEYRVRLDSASSLVVTEYRGLSAGNFNELRSEFSVQEADYLVVKNRIFKRVLKGGEFEKLAPYCMGQTAVLMADRELPDLLKILIRFKNEEGGPQLKAAVWDESFFDENQLKELSELPSRHELLGRTVGGIGAPLSGLASVLKGLLTGLAVVVKGIGDKKSG